MLPSAEKNVLAYSLVGGEPYFLEMVGKLLDRVTDMSRASLYAKK